MIDDQVCDQVRLQVWCQVMNQVYDYDDQLYCQVAVRGERVHEVEVLEEVLFQVLRQIEDQQ
jgi:hypothetical protein